MDRKFLSMNPKEIAKKYPKSWKKLKEWLASGSPEGKALDGNMLDMFVYGSPRMLYDFFDDNNIFVSVNYIREGIWEWEIHNTDAAEKPNRQDAELEALNRAYEIMEGKI